jgi:hypothetical protein
MCARASAALIGSGSVVALGGAAASDAAGGWACTPVWFSHSTAARQRRAVNLARRGAENGKVGDQGKPA